MKTRCGLCKQPLNTACVSWGMLGTNAVHQHCLERYRLSAATALAIAVIGAVIIFSILNAFGGSP